MPVTCGARPRSCGWAPRSASVGRSKLRKPGGSPWNAGAHPPQSIVADLGSPQRISALLLVPEMSPARAEVAHVVEVSDDGRTSRRAGEVRATMQSGELVELPIPGGVVARFVRVATVVSPSWVAWRDVVLVRCR